MFRGIVQTGRRESVTIREDVFGVVVLEKHLNEDSVVRIRDSTTIVALSGQIFESIEGSIVWVLL